MVHDPMGETAENIADMTKISRTEQDTFAAQSHQRAVAAMDAGRFKDEILPVEVHDSNGEPSEIAVDERPRRDTTVESLSRLKPAFRKEGSVTAGNSTGMNDGAAALVLMSADKAKALGLKPLVKLIASASAGVLPKTMGLGPIPATRKALKSRRVVHPRHSSDRSSMKLLPFRRWPSCVSWIWIRKSPMSMAVRSPWATRSDAPERAS